MRMTWASRICLALSIPISTVLAVHSHQEQVALMAAAAPDVIPQDAAPSVSTESSPQLLSDTLGGQRSLSIFASLARSDLNTSVQLSDQTGYMIILAPNNKALKAMGHKPWESPSDVRALGGHVFKGEPGMDEAQRNLRAFVHSYLVKGGSGDSEWTEGEVRTRGDQGKDVWWEVKDGKKTIMPEHITVDGVVSRVMNGEVWALDGTF